VRNSDDSIIYRYVLALVMTVIVAAHVCFTLCTYICILGHKRPGPGIVWWQENVCAFY